MQNASEIPSPNLGARDFHSSPLGASDDARPSPVGVEPHFYFVTDKHFNSVQTHLPGEIREYALPALKLHLKKSVGKRLIDDSMHNLKFSHICVA